MIPAGSDIFRSPQSRPRTVECRTCGGQYTAAPSDPPGRPYGWLSVSVSIPAAMSRRGKPYQWVGTYCSAACLADAADTIRQAEAAARQRFAADRPQRRPARADIARLMTERPSR